MLNLGRLGAASISRIIISFFLLFVFVGAAQHQDKVNFTEAAVELYPDAYNKSIAGDVDYKFRILQDVDSIFLDAQNLDIATVLLNNKKVKYRNNGKTLTVYKPYRKNRTYNLKISYTAKPKQTVYFIGWDSLSTTHQIWTQGQGKYTSHWLPSFDDMQEKVIFNLNIYFDKDYQVLANGKLMGVYTKGELNKWVFTMDRPMSSYLLAFAIGEFDKKELRSSSGIPLHLYYHPRDSLLVEPTYRYTREIFQFLEHEIGLGFPWRKYDQVPVRDFLYAGMENTGLTIFSEGFLSDSIAFNDRNYVNVNAHEMAHQWFGNLVTQTDSRSHWLHEGFATYYALLAEKEIFGEAYFHWKLYETAQKLKQDSLLNGGEALTDPKASSLTFYDKGAWAVHMLRQELGDLVYKAGVKQFLERYKYQNADIEQFLREMELVSGANLNWFKKKWLSGTTFPYQDVKDILVSESTEVAQFYHLQDALISTKEERQSIIENYWNKTESEYLRAKIIETYFEDLSQAFLKKALETNNLKIRQAIAINAKKIPLELKADFESLLNDESYLTQEHILYKLWIYFPEEREKYLNHTINTIGFPDRNMRILWLTLALVTKDYNPKNRTSYYEELNGYTDPSYPFEVRQNAFGMLMEVIGLSDKNLLDLIQAAQHHSWQFRQFSRKMIDHLLEEEGMPKRIENLMGKLNDEERRYMYTKLKKR